MIIWCNNLYMDGYVKKRQKKIMGLVEREKISPGLLARDIFCIALPSNEQNLFDIVRAGELFFEHCRRNQLRVLGLARGRDSAVELLTTIILDLYNETGELCPVDYFVFDPADR
ncbi:hypothetical protein [Anaerolentibacter hominis]|uniref:hypothetical protein n=1 Tax=Anaerolentibacter hominis TaxID=3079009 RepID=UPI0031B83FBA